MKKRFVQILSAVMILAMLCGTVAAADTGIQVPAGTVTDNGNNNTSAQAQTITLGDTISGGISPEGDVDFYKFTMSSSGRVSLDVTSYMRYYTLNLYDANGAQILSDDYNEWDASLGYRKDAYTIDLIAGTYFLKITGYSSSTYNPSTGTYTIATGFTPANATEREPNNSAAEANSLTLGNSVRGQIALNDAHDFYKFTLPASGRLNLDITAYMRYYTLDLYDSDGAQILSDDYNEWDASLGYRKDAYAIDLIAGTYFLKITGYSSSTYSPSTGTYTIATGFTPANATEREPNNSAAEANSLALGSTVRGQIALNDPYDFYKFSLSSARRMSLSFTSYMRCYTVSIYSTDGAEIWKDEYNEWDASQGYRKDNYTIDLEAGTYYLKVTDSRNSTYHPSTGNYSFLLSEPSPFLDVSQGQYYYEAVLWAVRNGITSGTDAHHFSPNQVCTRGQVVSFLWRAMGRPEPQSTKCPFKDVKTGSYYYKAVMWAYEKGITSGTDKTHFSPEATVTRGQFVSFLWRAKGKPSTSGRCPFVDVGSNQYYYDAVRWAANNHIASGTDATHFSPGQGCTRGQVVSFLYRAEKN